ncbi:MAG TPA: hypothetical protein VFO79_07910 [Xanthomonadales bacterium]|nr:hypothetical protein [Xanthomonadales bacterium]
MIWLVAWLVGCDIPPEVKAEMTCTTVCACFGRPIDQQECVDDCIAQGNFRVIPEDCFECIQAHANSCSTLEADCEPLCERTPPPDDTFPDGGMP